MKISTNQIAEMRVTRKEKIFDFLDSLFGPFVYALAVLLRVKTDYVKGEKLTLTEALGKPDKPSYIPANSTVVFDSNSAIVGDLDPIIAIYYQDRLLAVKEHKVKMKSWLKRKRISYEFNLKMMRSNKRLRKYHPFLAPKLIFIAYYYIKDKLEKRDV